MIFTMTEGDWMQTLLSRQKKCSGHFSTILLNARKSKKDECTQTRANVPSKLLQKCSTSCSMQSSSSSRQFDWYRLALKKNRLGVGSFLFSKMPSSRMVAKFLLMMRFMRSLKRGLLADMSYLRELRSSNILEPNALALIFYYLMDSDNKTNPFTQYSLHHNLKLLHSLPPLSPQLATRALAEGCFKRNNQKLYKGYQTFVQDLQVVLDHDRQNAPASLRQLKVLLNKEENTVLAQCSDCGRYMPPFRFCNSCQNAHFCSQACEIKGKLNHKPACRPRQLPSIDAALQMEVHVGGDLGRDVQIYYQHQLRMSHKIRGEEMINNVFNYLIGDGKNMLPADCQCQIFNGHIRIRRTADSADNTPTSANQPFVAQSIDKVASIYADNTVLSYVVLYLLGRGAVLTHLIRQVHNNHLHMIYIFLC